MRGRITTTARFSQVPEWVLDHREGKLSANAVRLYAILMRYANGDRIFPSRRTLAERMGVSSPRTVDAARVELERAGALSMASGKRAGETNDYVLAFERPFGGEQPTAHPRNGQGAQPAAQEGAQPAAQEGAQPAAHNRKKMIDNDVPDGTSAATTVRGADFVGHFVDEVRRVTGRDPLANAKDRMGRHANDLRKQGVDDDTIRAAITEVVEAGLMVGAVLAVADQVHRGGFRGLRKAGGGGMSAREIAAMAEEHE